MALAQSVIANLLAIASGGGDVRDRWRAFAGTLASAGLDQVNYGLLDPAAAQRDEAEVLFLSSMRDDWIAHYGAERFDLQDPHVVNVRAGVLAPYRYDSVRAADRIEDARTREIVGQSAEAGLRTHVQVVLLGREGTVPVGGMAIGSSLPRMEFERLVAGSEGELVTAANLFHQRALGALRRLRFDVRPLSPRERDCLQYVVAGLRPEQIADRLGIARATVTLHLTRARAKLRAATLPQAVARALDFGEIGFDGRI